MRNISVILDTRKMTTTGENAGKFPIKIKVSFTVHEAGRTRYVVRRFPTGVYASVKEFRVKRNSPAVSLRYADALKLNEKKLSPQDFERLFTGSGALEEIKTTFDFVIKRLREEERDGTANAYQQAYSSFARFKGEHIPFQVITPAWLRAYEQAMKKEGLSINTVGFYTRALRTIFNTAIDLKIISADLSPFGRRKYVVPTGQRRQRKAHTKDDVLQIMAFKSEDDNLNRAIDFWIFQYLCSGCNMADVAYLQFQDIDGDWLRFYRKKTEHTERNQVPIEVHITPRMREIIARRGQRSLDPDAYVFPILRDDMTSKQRKEAIKSFRKWCNEMLVLANEVLKIQPVPKTETARYTAVNVLKGQGIELKVIGRALGHGSEATTEHYTEQTREAQIMISRLLST